MSKPYGIRKPQRRLIPPEEERSHESSSGISDDLRYGQIVIVAARWMLVLSAFVLLLYRSDKINELVFGVVGLLGIAVANFWLHTKILRKQCVEDREERRAKAREECAWPRGAVLFPVPSSLFPLFQSPVA